ncbi:MAG TPA: hypothetical protein VGK87_02540 [Anaerolineae bacterium]|jgi:hypothetical protein
MLTIYTSLHCRGCARAKQLAQQVRNMRPAAPVRLIELDGESVWPEQVIGTPMYLWNQQVWYMGNPRIDELLARLDDHTKPSGTAVTG